MDNYYLDLFLNSIKNTNYIQFDTSNATHEKYIQYVGQVLNTDLDVNAKYNKYVPFLNYISRFSQWKRNYLSQSLIDRYGIEIDLSDYQGMDNQFYETIEKYVQNNEKQVRCRIQKFTQFQEQTNIKLIQKYADKEVEKLKKIRKKQFVGKEYQTDQLYIDLCKDPTILIVYDIEDLQDNGQKYDRIYYAKQSTIESTHIFCSKYLNLNGLLFAINTLMSTIFSNQFKNIIKNIQKIINNDDGDPETKYDLFNFVQNSLIDPVQGVFMSIQMNQQKIPTLDEQTYEQLYKSGDAIYYDQLDDEYNKEMKLEEKDQDVLHRIHYMFSFRNLNKYTNDYYKDFGLEYTLQNTKNCMILKPYRMKNPDIYYVQYKKGDYIYKGFKNFVNIQQDVDFIQQNKNLMGWFAQPQIASHYARGYGASMNQYEFTKDSKFIIINNKLNHQIILDFVQNNDKLLTDYYEQNETCKQRTIELLFCTHGMVANGERVNYNLLKKLFNSWSIDIGYTDKIIYLYKNVRNTLLYNDKTDNLIRCAAYQFDLPLSKLMYYFCQYHDLDGYYVASKNGYRRYATYSEIIINQSKCLKRIKGIHDWTSLDNKNTIFYEKLFGITQNWRQPITEYDFNCKILSSYRFYSVYKYYSENIYQTPLTYKNTFKFCSYNIYGKQCVNYRDRSLFYDKLIKFINDNDFEFICLLECSTWMKQHISDLILSTQSMNQYKCHQAIIYTGSGNLLLYKNNQNMKIHDVLLHRQGAQRYCTFFKINNIKYAVTHLEIGHRYNFQGKNPKELVDIYNENSYIRKIQLDEIIDQKPDVIMGDFNFVFLVDKKETKILTDNGYQNTFDKTINGRNYSHISGSRVDFIFSKLGVDKQIKSYYEKINISDHLPVIGYM